MGRSACQGPRLRYGFCFAGCIREMARPIISVLVTLETGNFASPTLPRRRADDPPRVFSDGGWHDLSVPGVWKDNPGGP